MSTPKRPSPNGKPRLLPFLRGLLNDPSHSDIIIWNDQDEQQFQLVQPEKVAKLWGSINGNPDMNYDKMSRGLRYLYKEDQSRKATLKKIHGKDFKYQFLDSMDGSLSSNTSPVTNFINNSLSSSPTSSSSSSAGSTSPSSSDAALLTPLTPDQLSQLTQNILQFNKFIAQFPYIKTLPIFVQLQMFFTSKASFPSLFQ
uniref:ETS domain-containing protein n=1 Tax=Caenorhabditis tropicalis TaxID=1561998 RepID=A0A1I7TVL9_9PELO